MDRSLFDAARRRPALLLAAATALFVALMAVQAQADSHAPSTVTLCANPAGQLTIAPQSGCSVNTTAFQVATADGLADATADLAAADAALADRLDTLEATVEDLVIANTELTTRVTDLETANTELITRLGAAEGRIDDLDSLVSEFEEIVEELDEAVGVLEDLVDGLLGAVDLSADVEELQATFDGVTRDGNTLLFSGMNLQVVNGTDTTDGAPNGKGNLIVGYDTARLVNSDKSGSHYLVIGDNHNYTAFGGIVAGLENTVSGDWASVFGGGPFNTASGEFASVSAGTFNKASGDYASVSGGSGHDASGLLASVSGGFGNTASGERASVSGGQLNTASGFASSILGGISKTVSDDNGTFPQ